MRPVNLTNPAKGPRHFPLAVLLALLFLVVPSWAAYNERYLPAFQAPEMGRYFLDTEGIERQDGVFLFRYKNIVSWRYRNQALKGVEKKDERLRIKRWAYSIVTLYYDPARRAARPAISTTWSKTDELLTRKVHQGEPFAPVDRSPALAAICSVLMDYVTAHPEAVRERSG